MASTSAGAIGVTLSADTVQFDSSMDKSAAVAERSMQRTQKAQQAAQKDADKLVASIQRQIDTFGMSGTALLAYEARLKGAGDQAQPLLDRLERLRDAQAAFNTQTASSGGIGNVGKGFEEAANSAGHAAHGTAGITRELIVLGHEASQGRYTRLGGSLMVMGELAVGMGLSLTGVLLPLIAVGAAVGTLIAAIAIGAHETTLLNNAMKVTGNYAGVTQSSVTALSHELSTTLGVGIGKARSALEELVKTGEVGPAAIKPMATAVLQLETLTGESTETIVKDFAKMGDGVAKWAEEHNKQYNYVSGDQYAYIKQLEEQGNKEAAETENLRLLNEHLATIKPNLGYLERAWKSLGETASEAWERMKGVGRAETVDDAIATQQKRVDQLSKKPFGSFAGMAADNTFGQHLKPNADAADVASSDLRLLKLAKEAEANSVLAKAEDDRAHKAQVAAIDSRDRWREETKGVSLVNKELEKYRTLTVDPLKGTANAISASEQAAEEAAIRKKYDVHSGGDKAAKQLDTRYKDRLEALTAEGIKLDQEAKNFQKYGKAINDSHLALVNLEIAQGKLQGLSPEKIATLQAAAASDDAKAKLLSETEAKAKATAAADKLVEKLHSEVLARATNAEQTELSVKLAQLEATGLQKGTQAYADHVDAIERDVAAKHDQILVNKLKAEQLVADDEVHKIQDEIAALGQSTLARQNATIAQKEYVRAQALIAANPGQAPEILDAQLKRTQELTAANTDLYNAQRTAEAGAGKFFQQYSEDADNAAKTAQLLASKATTTLEDSLAGLLSNQKVNFKSMVDSLIAEVLRLTVLKPFIASIFGTTGSNGSGADWLSTIAGWFGGGGTSGATAGAGAGSAGDWFATTLATGTNYVPYDGLKATLHKGEAVVPAAYNPAAGGRMARSGDIHVHMTGNPGMSRASAYQQGRDIAAGLAMANARNG